MRSPRPTMASEWEEFKAELPKELTEEHMPLLEYCFRSGFFAMQTIAMEFMSVSDSRKAQMVMLRRFFNEHSAFLEKQQ